MAMKKNMFWGFVLVVAEILVITFWDYKMAGEYYSLDVLYCLPIIQAAHLSTIRSLRHSDTQMSALVGVIAAVAWSIAEAAVVWPLYPLGAFTMNIFTRSVTFTVLGRVVTKLWKERDYSRRDALTGLANRLEFNERFEAEQLRSERSSRPYSLLFIDIDQFKMLNDNQGHRVGDAALKTVSGILRNNSRSVDTVARIGGDQFVLLFPETDEYICGILVTRIKLASEKKFQTEGWSISLSIAHVTVTGSARSFDELLHEADEQMHSIKMQMQKWGEYNSANLAEFRPGK
jgi:diguanylate cyclase (GGDEF)-like protein